MDNRDFAQELEKRTREFAVKIIRLSAFIPTTPEGRVLRNQITKSGTYVAANYREANRSRSKADFRNKVKICESEASETLYWLEVIVEADFLKLKKVKTIHEECSEILAYFYLDRQETITSNFSHFRHFRSL